MESEVVLLVGLPGSGKTTYLSQMLQDGWLIFDDFKALAINDCSKFRSSQGFPKLIRALRDGRRCVVADINFCKTESREEAERDLLAEVPSVSISRRFFENDPFACEANLINRNRQSLQNELRDLQAYSPFYYIPEGSVVLPVWRKS
jgi:hypothetical protein